MAKQADATVQVELHEIKSGKGLRTYSVWIPGFGNPGCTVKAENANEAGNIVGEFIGNELMARNVLYPL